MTVLVNAALGALAGVVGYFVGSLVFGAKLALPLGILGGLVGYFLGGSLAPAASPKSVTNAVAEWEDEAAAKKAKKAKKAAAEARKKEEAQAAKEAEAAAKAAEKKAAKKAAELKAKKAAGKAAAVVASSESESEAEEEEDSAPKSKSALKKAKAKAKAAAEKAAAEAAAKAAAKKAKKSGAAAPVVEAAAPAKKAAPAADKKAAAAAAAADLDGWETIEATKPTKAQLAKLAAGADAQPEAKKKKGESTPASERLLTEDIIVPTKQHAFLIGPKGATLNLLQSGSGATIDMPKRETASAKIQITGTPAQVAAAKNAIQSLVERGFSSITHPGTLSDDISLENANIGAILGDKGSNIRAIQDKTGAKIQLPERDSNSKRVTIVGEKEGVKAAKAALRSLIQDGFSTLTHEGWIKVEVPFPGDKFGILIGPKGQTIKSIQGNSKRDGKETVRINLPEKNSKATTVTLVGLQSSINQAQKEIEKLLEPLAPLPDPEEEDLATDDAWGQEHTAQGEDALWA